MDENQTAPPKKPASHYVSLTILFLILIAVPIVYFRDSLPFAKAIPAAVGETVDLSGQAEDALRQHIASDSGGQINLSSFRKTDGQDVEMFGVKGYNLKFEGEVTFASSGFWLAHNPMAGGGLTFTFSPTQVAFGGMNGATQVSAGSRVRIAGTMSGQKSESGWHFELSDCGEAQN